MTIFGYNTDVRNADTVYHVQSEARQNDLLLQTLVYVKGQCVGKRTFSYAAKTLEGGFSDEAIHELLKAQHKGMVDAVQAGHVESVLTPGEITDVGGDGLVLNWINSRDPIGSGSLNMRLQVLDKGKPVSGAEIMLLPGAGEKELAHGRTDATGNAEIHLNIGSLEEPAVIARAIRSGRSATRKFRFRK